MGFFSWCLYLRVVYLACCVSCISYYVFISWYMIYNVFYSYTMAHIWACPPSEGDDYIFHCHPAEQKIPKPKRLQEWYKKMLDKGIIERIVLDYKVGCLYSNRL